MIALLATVWVVAQPSQPSTESVFLPDTLRQAAAANVARSPWARAVRDRVVRAAEPWMGMTDEQLWGLMFGNTIRRSWMVWSDGHCPACKKPVPMYNWMVDALQRPWKVQCPHCKELFPKNDFERFYRSGLDRHGVFDPARADRSLLYNVEHADPNDPLRGFGVDDGEGYTDGTHRWRFIGAYLIYGQWKQAVLGGISRLAAAYVLTGDRSYAHRAGVLLDRVADLYPTFDFAREGVLYEGPGSAGYISTWHDACEETRELALAYDYVRPALASDVGLVRFLSAQAARYGLENPKRSWPDIRRNIEDRVLRDAIANRAKIHSNYPRTEIALATILMVLGWPGNRDEVFGVLDPMLEQATAADGVTGEKGLAGYSAFTIQGLGDFLGQLVRIEPGILEKLLRRHPRLRETYRFHIDTYCLGSYYPLSGDTGAFAMPVRRYCGLTLRRGGGLEPSGFDLLLRLTAATGDPAFAQTAYVENGRKVDGIPYDIFARDPEACRRALRGIVRRHGPEPRLSSVRKEQWRLAILRSGRGEQEAAVWLDYDAGGGHGHADALNLGLFALGLDLLPEFGYPPVQFGGWGSPRARWYTMTAAHNTVLVDRQNQRPASGRSTLWVAEGSLQVLRAECPAAAGARRFERTLALCGLPDGASYLVDVFRVAGGSEHLKLQHSHYGTLALEGVSLKELPDFGEPGLMRAFRMGPSNGPTLAVWALEDRLGLLPPGRKAFLRHWELTENAAIGTCEAWIVAGLYNSAEEAWIPRLVVRRTGEDLDTTFTAVLSWDNGEPRVLSARRIPLQGEGGSDTGQACAVEIVRADGVRDILVFTDPAASGRAALRDGSVQLDGECARVALDRSGSVTRAEIAGCRSLVAGDLKVTGPGGNAYVELDLQRGRPRVRMERGGTHEIRLTKAGGKR